MLSYTFAGLFLHPSFLFCALLSLPVPRSKYFIQIVTNISLLLGQLKRCKMLIRRIVGSLLISLQRGGAFSLPWDLTRRLLQMAHCSIGNQLGPYLSGLEY